MKIKKKEKIKVLFKYYKDLLELYNSLRDKEFEDNNLKQYTLEKLKERIILLERKLKFKFTKICWKCGSFELKYRVSKGYIINICKKCGYQNFIKIKKEN